MIVRCKIETKKNYKIKDSKQGSPIYLKWVLGNPEINLQSWFWYLLSYKLYDPKNKIKILFLQL